MEREARAEHPIRGFSRASDMKITFACAVVMTTASPAYAQPPKSPLVLVVGCASKSAQPHIWTLSNAGERSESSRPGILEDEKANLATRPLGQGNYQLIGVADFVDVDTSRAIGVRGELLTPSRVNATSMLADGHKVAVKGLYITAAPPRINLTSVVDLGARCP